jgi:hypothetical protein
LPSESAYRSLESRIASGGGIGRLRCTVGTALGQKRRRVKAWERLLRATVTMGAAGGAVWRWSADRWCSVRNHGPGNRFASEALLAAYAGGAPLKASSAGSVRHRLNRHGNRRLNAILYRIVLTQARGFPEAKAYLTRRTSQGKTMREAFRALKRYIIRAIWRLWQRCQATPDASAIALVA